MAVQHGAALQCASQAALHGQRSVLRELRAAALDSLSARWLPQALVYVGEMVDGPGGAHARFGLARRLDLPGLSDECDAKWRATMVGDRLLSSPAASAHALQYATQTKTT